MLVFVNRVCLYVIIAVSAGTPGLGGMNIGNMLGNPAFMNMVFYTHTAVLQNVFHYCIELRIGFNIDVPARISTAVRNTK